MSFKNETKKNVEQVVLCWFFFSVINRVFMSRVQHNILKVIYILTWSEVKRESFLKKPKYHLKDFHNFLVFGLFSFLGGEG